MANTRGPLGTKFRDFVGPGKEFLPSEVPTLRAVLQRGILIKERIVLEEGRAKTDVPTSEIVQELAVLIQQQWQILNAKFCPPVVIQEYSLRKKLLKLWVKVEQVALGKVGSDARERVLDMIGLCWTIQPAPARFFV